MVVLKLLYNQPYVYPTQFIVLGAWVRKFEEYIVMVNLDMGGSGGVGRGAGSWGGGKPSSGGCLEVFFCQDVFFFIWESSFS